MAGRARTRADPGDGHSRRQACSRGPCRPVGPRAFRDREGGMKFRKKPVEIEAVHYLGGNDREGYRFAEMQPPWLSAAFNRLEPECGVVWRNLDGTLSIRTL